MANDVIILGLEGEVTLGDFATATKNLADLLEDLSSEIAEGAKVEWIIEELSTGSAVATLRGTNHNIKSVERIVDAYEVVGESLQSGRDIPYSGAVRKHASNIAGIINDKVTAVRFETRTKDYLISGKTLEGQATQPVQYSFGVVRGIDETLSSRRKLSFTLWDSLFDRPIHCYFKLEDEELMREAWDKRVVVSGRIGRQAETGKPIVVRDISAVEIIKDVEPGSYRLAKGVVPWSPGDEWPEQTIRRIRDAV